ncbi:uncharacterized protein ACOB8E_014989 isoform 2-T2 [Sarcophilus harrisii]
MASPSGTPEDSGKQRGRDGKMRREEDDTPPEGKRLKLGKEGDGGKEEGEDMPCLGREDTGTQTGGEGRSAQLALSYSLAETQDYKSDNSALTSSAKSSPQGPVLTSQAASKFELFDCSGEEGREQILQFQEKKRVQYFPSLMIFFSFRIPLMLLFLCTSDYDYQTSRRGRSTSLSLQI